MNNKWQTWYDSLPSHTKQSLSNQLWTDKDVAGFMLVALIVGILIGWSI